MAKKKRDSSPGSIPTGTSPENQQAAEGQQARKTPISGGSGYYAEGSQPVAPAPVYKSDYYSGQQGGVYTPYGDGVSQSSSTMAEGQVSQSSPTHAGDGGAPMDKEHSIKALIGRTIDRYKIIKLLGEGGFGAVYKAEHTLMKRDVAFKTLHKELGKDPAVLHRFKKEGQVAARFKHKNCIELYDFGQMDDGTYFMAMEFLPGKDLRDILKKKGALELGETFDIMIQSLAGLQAAHDGGVIHRDLKPDNIKLEEREGRTDFVKILDFGIAKIIHKDLPETALDHQTGKMTEGEAGKIISEMGNTDGVDPAESGFKTQVGAFFGTPEYGSPEQCAGEEIDARSDIYTMGVILYELLTGSLPFVSKTPQGYLAQHMVAPPRPISEIRPDLKIPAEVEAIIMKALEKRREDRYQNCNEMAQAMVDAAQKCGIAITVEGGGTVVIKTPTWKIATMVGVPVLIVLATATYIVQHQKDDVWDQAKSQYSDLVGKKRYEEAKLNLENPSNIDLKIKHGSWIDEKLAEVEKKIVERDARFKGVEAAADAFEGTTLTARESYDQIIERVERAAKEEEAIASDWGTKFKGMDDALIQLRESDAQTEWAARLKDIGQKVEDLQFEEATQVCSDFPAKFRNAEATWKAVQAKKDDIQQIKLNTKPEEFQALAKLNEARKFRADKPRDWPNQLAALDALIAAFPGRKASDQAQRVIRPEWLKDFEATGEKELQDIKDKVEEQLALETRDGLDKSFDLWRSWDQVFHQGAKTAEEHYLAYKRDRIDAVAHQRYDKDIAQAHDLRDHFQPDAGVKLVAPWMTFENIPEIRRAAIAEVESFNHAIAQHQDMVLVPASNAVQIGEPEATLPSGPIQLPVSVTAFYIDRAEVSNAQYYLYLQDVYDSDLNLHSQFKSREEYIQARCPRWWLDPEKGGTGRPVIPTGLEDHPVRGVTFKDAVAFAHWAGKRLPTEVEWEYAARGPTYWDDSERTKVHDFPWGARGNSTGWTFLCRFWHKAGETVTYPVRSFETGKSVPFGLYNMAGNVAEWTDSPYARYEHPRSRTTTEKYDLASRVVRGGSYFYNNLNNCRAANRENYGQDEVVEYVGFRCVKPAVAK
ncbi:MAG TPA: SUMF1/EgtB/PvdO family nonheme iron enzyme [Planctomycetota bacterium]|nr:SUMF1/EgtB/PvdO family nonheme iron enzyme [Planctomycetota bacterium]